MTLRIIPRLDIKGPNLVKGIHLEGLRVLGKPERFAQFYYENGADELFYMDTVASLYGRNHLGSMIESTAREIFIPLTVGGGLRSVEDIRAVLRAGADKVAVNTAAIRRPEFISEAAAVFGSSTIVVVIEAVRQPDGRYLCFTDGGREETGVEAVDWARRAAELGAGELCVTSVDREGTGDGFDLQLIRSIADAVRIPIIAHGGAGRADHLASLATDAQVSAIMLASILHYGTINLLSWQESDFAQEGNIEFMRRKGAYAKVTPATLSDIKAVLIERGFDVRS